MKIITSLFTGKTKYFVIGAIVAVFLFMYFMAGCNGCKKSNPVISVIPAIEQAAKPLEDSLRREVSALNDSITQLKKRLYSAAINQQVAKEKGTATIAARGKAKEIHDTVTVDSLCDQLEEDFRQYAASVAHEDSVQTELIESQAVVITNQAADLELQKSKFNQVKIAYEDNLNRLNEDERKLQKMDRKLRRSHFLNKVFGGIAAVAVGFIALTR